MEAGKDAVTEAIDDFTYEESDDEDGGEGGEGSAETPYEHRSRA